MEVHRSQQGLLCELRSLSFTSLLSHSLTRRAEELILLLLLLRFARPVLSYLSIKTRRTSQDQRLGPQPCSQVPKQGEDPSSYLSPLGEPRQYSSLENRLSDRTLNQDDRTPHYPTGLHHSIQSTHGRPQELSIRPGRKAHRVHLPNPSRSHHFLRSHSRLSSSNSSAECLRSHLHEPHHRCSTDGQRYGKRCERSWNGEHGALQGREEGLPRNR